MKNNRGFTLVEMLGVLIILIMIFMIVFPSLTKMIKDTNDKIDSATVSIIEEAAASYLSEKSDVYPKDDEYTYCITLTNLIDNANLTEKQISSLPDKDMVVKTTFVDRKPVYVLTKSCTDVVVDINFALVGEKNMEFEVGVGGQYVEPGATAVNKAGQTVSYVATITNSKKETVVYVDTTKVGIYTVKYSATIDGENYSIERIVKVVDTTAPTLTVNPISETIAITNNSYNVLTGVTASDNSGDVPTLKTSTNLSLGQAGTYYITYTATDSSGNKKTAKRTVMITDKALVNISIGIKSVTHEINSGAYIDAGATAQDAASNDLTSGLTKTIRKGGSIVAEVAVDKLATYYVTYSIVKDNVTYSETRTVVINDTTKPVIVGASDTTIYTNNSTFNVMAGVSATDNSGETISISTSSNLTLGVVGTYTVTYTATDSSGNTATATRTITVLQAYTVYANGAAVYFNPVTGAKCDAASAVSTTGTKTGCMKWYAFNDGGASIDTINLILDHNTTALVAWNSTGSNVNGPTNIMTQLASDTSSWAGVPTRTDSYSVSNGTATYTINYSTYKARLIKASEIATITGNSSFVEATTPYTSWFYLDSNNQTQTATTTGASNYDWLFDYTNGCTSYGCNIADASNAGYWTTTAVSGITGNAWDVSRYGLMYYNYVASSDLYGVRPVITILKSNL